MDLKNHELLAIALSPFFIISATAIVRKYVPKIDGWKVLVFVTVLSELLCITERLLTHPEQWPYGMIAGLILAVVSLGANEKGTKLANSFTQALFASLTQSLVASSGLNEATDRSKGNGSSGGGSDTEKKEVPSEPQADGRKP